MEIILISSEILRKYLGHPSTLFMHLKNMIFFLLQNMSNLKLPSLKILSCIKLVHEVTT